MKKVYTLILFIIVQNALYAQGVFSNKTTAALQKVIEDYPNRFKNIRGERVSEHAQTVEYKSRIEIAGATHCQITENTVATKEQYSWNCQLFTATDFEQARVTYRELFNQIRNTIIKIEGEKPFILNGRYENPEGEKKSTTVRFDFLPAPEIVRQLKVELTLQYTTGWKIILSVYDQERNFDLANATR